MCNLLDDLHDTCFAMRDVKGQHKGYRSLELNWPNEAMNRPIKGGIVDGAIML